MSDYSAVAPPTNFSQSSAFAAALQRARQIAAKINPGGAAAAAAAGDTSGQKRPLEDGSEPEAKKVAAVNDPAGAQLAALRAQQVTSPGATVTSSAAAQAAAQAAAVAARVAAATAAGLQGLGVGVSIGPVQNEDIRVPDKMVGLIIGRGGEQITRLQNESGCKIQMAPDSGGMPERVCTLTGSRDSINRAKELIMNIVQQRSRTEGVGPGMGEMNMGGPGNHSHHVLVPRAAVGVVIGKGGDMIKKIQNETGARVQFQQGRDDGPGERRCLLTGKPNQVEQARRRIEELIDSVLRRDSEIGRGRGRGGPGGPPFDRMGRGAGGGGDFGNGGWDRRPGGMQQGQMDKQEATATFTIPAAKCGIVIGRGGETIKQINQQTGAHCELDRRPSANPAEKVFVIRGAPDQIEQAKRIISEKIGMPPGPGGPPAQYPLGQGPPGGQGPPQHFAPQGWGGGGYQPWQNQQHPNDPNAPGGGGGGQVQVNPATGQPDYSIQWAEYYRSLGMHREAEMIEQQAKQQAMQPQQPQPAAPQPQPQPTAATQNGQPDYSAQWAEYYRSIGKIKEAEAIEAQMKAGKPGGGAGPPGPQQPQPQPGPGPQPQPGPGPQQSQQPAYGQPYGYQATNYYGAAPVFAPGPQPPQQSQQPYNYPNYGGYGAQPGGPENQ